MFIIFYTNLVKLKKNGWHKCHSDTYFRTKGVYESSVENILTIKFVCLIGKLRHRNDIKKFDSHGHPHGSVQSILILHHTQMATLKL